MNCCRVCGESRTGQNRSCFQVDSFFSAERMRPVAGQKDTGVIIAWRQRGRAGRSRSVGIDAIRRSELRNWAGGCTDITENGKPC